MKINKSLLHHHINNNTAIVYKNKYGRFLDKVVHKNSQEQTQEGNIRNTVNEELNVSLGKESVMYPKTNSNGYNQSIPRSKDPFVYNNKNGEPTTRR